MLPVERIDTMLEVFQVSPMQSKMEMQLIFNNKFRSLPISFVQQLVFFNLHTKCKQLRKITINSITNILLIFVRLKRIDDETYPHTLESCQRHHIRK